MTMLTRCTVFPFMNNMFSDGRGLTVKNILHFPMLTSGVIYKFSWYTCLIVTHLAVCIFLITCGHVDACPTVQIFVVHLYTWTHFRLLKCYCTRADGGGGLHVQILIVHVYISTYVLLYNFWSYPCTIRDLSYYTNFYRTRAHDDKRRSVENCVWTRVYNRTFPTGHILSHTYPRWYVSYRGSIWCTRVHVCMCPKVQIFVVHSSTWKYVVQ